MEPRAPLVASLAALSLLLAGCAGSSPSFGDSTAPGVSTAAPLANPPALPAPAAGNSPESLFYAQQGVQALLARCPDLQMAVTPLTAAQVGAMGAELQQKCGKSVPPQPLYRVVGTSARCRTTITAYVNAPVPETVVCLYGGLSL